MDPADRTLRARLAAHASWAATTDPAGRTAKARGTFTERFVKQAREMHPGASEQQIAEVAEHLRKAHYTRMGLASAKARRAKTAARRSQAA